MAPFSRRQISLNPETTESHWASTRRNFGYCRSTLNTERTHCLYDLLCVAGRKWATHRGIFTKISAFRNGKYGKIMGTQAWTALPFNRNTLAEMFSAFHRYRRLFRLCFATSVSENIQLRSIIQKDDNDRTFLNVLRKRNYYCSFNLEAGRLWREEQWARSIPVKNLHRSVVNFVPDNINLMLRNQVEVGFLGQKLAQNFVSILNRAFVSRAIRSAKIALTTQ